MQASIVEPSTELELQYKPIVITTNIDGVKAKVLDIIEPFSDGVDVSTDELRKQASNALAGLNKIKEKIKRTRIDKFKEIKEPITAEEQRVMALERMIAETYATCKAQIDAAMEAKKQERYADLMAEYEGVVGPDIAKVIPFDKIINPSLCNISYGRKKAEDELSDIAIKTVKEIKQLHDMQDKIDNFPQVLTHYYKNLDLQEALAEDGRINNQKAEQARLIAESEAALKVEKTYTPPTPSPEPIPTPQQIAMIIDDDAEKDTYVFVVDGISLDHAKEIGKLIEAMASKPKVFKNPSFWQNRPLDA